LRKAEEFRDFGLASKAFALWRCDTQTNAQLMRESSSTALGRHALSSRRPRNFLLCSSSSSVFSSPSSSREPSPLSKEYEDNNDDLELKPVGVECADPASVLKTLSQNLERHPNHHFFHTSPTLSSKHSNNQCSYRAAAVESSSFDYMNMMCPLSPSEDDSSDSDVFPSR
jgi:hypothetical protein